MSSTSLYTLPGRRQYLVSNSQDDDSEFPTTESFAEPLIDEF